LNTAPNSLEEVAGDVAARAFQRLKQQRIVLKFDDDLPLVRFDYGLILQALTNLVDNALRYERPDLQIELRGNTSQGEARVLVINHGETITAEEREHLMEPFYHGKDGHIGLGLAIAKGVVEAHRGRLWLEDTPGGGATFIIALPLDKEAIHEPENSGGG
jgi:two-component system sensor histidine kinase KdpD